MEVLIYDIFIIQLHRCAFSNVKVKFMQHKKFYLGKIKYCLAANCKDEGLFIHPKHPSGDIMLFFSYPRRVAGSFLQQSMGKTQATPLGKTAESKHIHRKLSGRKRSGRKRYPNNREYVCLQKSAGIFSFYTQKKIQNYQEYFIVMKSSLKLSFHYICYYQTSIKY